MIKCVEPEAPPKWTLRRWILDGIGCDREICFQKFHGLIEGEEITYEEMSEKFLDFQGDKFEIDYSSYLRRYQITFPLQFLTR